MKLDDSQGSQRQKAVAGFSVHMAEKLVLLDFAAGSIAD